MLDPLFDMIEPQLALAHLAAEPMSRYELSANFTMSDITYAKNHIFLRTVHSIYKFF